MKFKEHCRQMHSLHEKNSGIENFSKFSSGTPQTLRQEIVQRLASLIDSTHYSDYTENDKTLKNVAIILFQIPSISRKSSGCPARMQCALRPCALDMSKSISCLFPTNR